MKKYKQHIADINGRPLDLYTMHNDHGMQVSFLNCGGALCSLHVPDKNGMATDVISGYSDLTRYTENPPFFGALVGRVANRIANAEFNIDGKHCRTDKNYEGRHTLHGGGQNFSNYFWQVSETDNGFVLYGLFTPAYDGMPGILSGTVSYTLESNALNIVYRFTTDEVTIVNITSHPYFNLNGEGNGNILSHRLMLNADFYLSSGASLINDGAILSVQGTPFDFTVAHKIGADIHNPHPMMVNAGGGYDLCYALKDCDAPAAILTGDKSGIEMTVFTNQPGIQLYTSNSLHNEPAKTAGRVYGKYDFVCLETQHFPGSEVYSHFPSARLNPGEVYNRCYISLLAGLLLIIAFSGYENFVSKMGIKNHEDRPAWMGKVGFSDLKLKLIGAIVAISAIELLKAFVEIGDGGIEQDILMWKIIVHITFAVSGVLFAVTDLIVAKSKSDGAH
ncbi:hypothetical protein CHS0354_035214 [Potamilus streckersoni]|uniref:Galactose mutarotase n=1 Tax=Potamilus streckersoni TaxID=2493646 RepID=A0AAE0S2W9_9BIVA|nr:hypothetical protein CHS0354_035214 [Potamilus streckersoni]